MVGFLPPLVQEAPLPGLLANFAYGAASVELIRHHRDPVPPLFDSAEQPPAGAFEEISSDFGEFRRD